MSIVVLMCCRAAATRPGIAVRKSPIASRRGRYVGDIRFLVPLATPDTSPDRRVAFIYEFSM